MRVEFRIVTAILLACLVAPGAMAVNVGTNITTFDGQVGNNWGGAVGLTAFDEDQETEPNTVQTNAWDLEGFFLDVDVPNLTATLNMVGTFDFQGALPDPTAPGYADRTDADSGDLFIATGAGQFFLDMNWATLAYNLYQVTGATTLTGTTVRPLSAPWRADGGTLIAAGSATIQHNVTIDDHVLYGTTALPNSTANTLNGLHNVVSFDWAEISTQLGLSQGDQFNLHFTMACGNDDLRGFATQPFVPVPEPASMALLGMGILGFAMRRRFTA